MNYVCIAVDRLHSGYLGCFGNTWAATPACDRLAADGFAFDHAIIDTPDLHETYTSLWGGTHAVARASKAFPEVRPSLAELARIAGLRSLLITDESIVAEHALGAAFDEALELEPPPADAATAADVESTHAARLFAAASRRVSEIDGPFFWWIHARGLGGPWDAPYAFRTRYADEDDPPPPTFAAVPRRELPADVDLDERFGIAQAYAGQVTLFDACLGAFFEQLEEAEQDADTAIVLFSPRGLALGEHGVVGPYDDGLYGELVKTPWIVRLPGARGALRRSQALVQPCDLHATLRHLLTGSSGEATAGIDGRSVLPLIDGEATAFRDRTLTVGDGNAAMRTAAWHWRRGVRNTPNREQATETRDELFVKPDDFWEVNDVADRCPDVVEKFAASWAESLAAIQQAIHLPALDDVLSSGLE